MKKVWLALILCAGCYNQKPTAEREAHAYIAQMYPHAAFTVSCMNVDTDSNGYVSCDAVIDGHQTALECAASNGCWSAFQTCNDGCKLRPMVQIQQTQPQ